MTKKDKKASNSIQDALGVGAIPIDLLEDILSLKNLKDRCTPDDNTPKEDDLEYDLKTTRWIEKKIRKKESYAQNLYAALCNNVFIKISVPDTTESILKILGDKLPEWSCSWRHAGGIIADIIGSGDYLDWYCSGIIESDPPYIMGYGHRVSEGVVTGEIEADLKKLGWVVVQNTGN